MTVSMRYLAFLLLASFCLASAGKDDVRSRLLTKILLEYSALLPPIQDNEPVRVQVSVSPRHIGQPDINDGTVNFQFLLRQNWTDYKISWSRDEYNISSTYLPRRILWIPDMVARNGGSAKENLSRDLAIEENGQVIDVRNMDVTVPCHRGDAKRQFTDTSSKRPLANKDANDARPVDGSKEVTRLVCSLALGSWIENMHDLVFEPVIDDKSHFHTDLPTAAWKVESITSYSSSEAAASGTVESSIAVVDITLVRNATLKYLPLQIVIPSVLTSLAATFVFSLPPRSLARERLIMVALGFTAQIVLAGISVMAQSQSDSFTDLCAFTIFSVVYLFLLLVAVLILFLLYPFIKRPASSEVESGEDQAELIKIPKKQVITSIPDIVVFIFFMILYCTGMATIFS